MVVLKDVRERQYIVCAAQARRMRFFSLESLLRRDIGIASHHCMLEDVIDYF